MPGPAPSPERIETVDAAIERLVREAPPLTETQRAEIAVVLRGTGRQSTGGEAA
jgi:hypothetical protein